MAVYNYENITWEFTGGSVINCVGWQEGVKVFLRGPNGETLEMFFEKENATRLSDLIRLGRKYWSKFRLSRLVKV